MVDLLRYAVVIATLPKMDIGAWTIGWREAGPNGIVYECPRIGQTVQLAYRDIRTGRDHPLKGLSHLIGFHKHGTFEISPDGKLAMWHHEEGGIGIATLTGHFLQEIPGSFNMSDFAWIDSTHYLLMNWSKDDDNVGRVEVRQVGRNRPVKASTFRVQKRPSEYVYVSAEAWADIGLRRLISRRLKPPAYSHWGSYNRYHPGWEVWPDGQEIWLDQHDGTSAHRFGAFPPELNNEHPSGVWTCDGQGILLCHGHTLYRIEVRAGAHGKPTVLPRGTRLTKT